MKCPYCNVCIFEFPLFQLGGVAWIMDVIGLVIAAFVLVKCFVFLTDRYGKTRRFLYENGIYGYEVNILKERINGK